MTGEGSAATPGRLRVAFAGTPEFARVALERLHAEGFDIPLVLTQPDRPAGRGMKLQPSAVKAFAGAHGLPVAQPRSLRLDGKYPDDAQAARDALEAAAPDAMVVAAYGLILPDWVLALPRLGCLNIHASLLPRWRGAAPIHRAIEAGDAETGVTLMQMDAGLDTGDMLLEARVPIAADTTTGRLHDTLAEVGGRLAVQALHDAAAGRLAPRPQPVDGITYARKIEKAEAALDWRLPAAQLARRIRAFDPAPGGATELGGEPLKVWAARAVAGDAGATAPGTVVAVAPDAIHVATGEGLLVLTEVQRPGGRRLPVADFLRGRDLKPGMMFEPAAPAAA